MNEKEKTVLITGASGGIGRAIALEAADAGYRIIAHYNKGADKAAALKAEIEGRGGQCALVQFDIVNRDECREKLTALGKETGALWGLVLNAGICADNTFLALKGEEWDKVLRTDLDSFYNVIAPLLMPMARKKQGRIITMASVSGVAGNKGQVNYSAAKSGIMGASKALALELASRGITVNCIAPGIIDTDMTRGLPMDQVIPGIPMGRVGKPEEVAALAVFLLSDQASYITRQVISVNGGMV
jgi:3-oxoacyl-[acyl-carrier protein] reductase